jgi:hypothetical protein
MVFHGEAAAVLPPQCVLGEVPEEAVEVPPVLVPWPMTVASRRPRPSPILNVPTTYASGGLAPASLGCSLLADGSSVPASDRIVQTLAAQGA